LGAVGIDGRERLSKASRNRVPRGRREADADVAIHLRDAGLDTPHGAVLHLPYEDALASVGALLGLAEQGMAPQRTLETLGQTQLDACLAHRSALRQQIGRVDADVAHVPGDA